MSEHFHSLWVCFIFFPPLSFLDLSLPSPPSFSILSCPGRVDGVSNLHLPCLTYFPADRSRYLPTVLERASHRIVILHVYASPARL